MLDHKNVHKGNSKFACHYQDCRFSEKPFLSEAQFQKHVKVHLEDRREYNFLSVYNNYVVSKKKHGHFYRKLQTILFLKYFQTCTTLIDIKFVTVQTIKKILQTFKHLAIFFPT